MFPRKTKNSQEGTSIDLLPTQQPGSPSTAKEVDTSGGATRTQPTASTTVRAAQQPTAAVPARPSPTRALL